jgi:DNA processing protein
LSPAEEALVNCLRESGQLQIDDICLKAGMATSTVMVHLLNLELNGMVRSLPGKMYTLC